MPISPVFMKLNLKDQREIVVLKAAGFETVRAVTIDEDWSALRFRRIE